MIRKMGSDQVVKIYLWAVMIILLFCSDNAISNNYASLVCPYIPLNANHLVFICSILTYVVLCIKKRRIIFSLPAALMIQYVCLLIANMVLEDTIYLLGNYGSILNGIMVFLIVSNYTGELDSFKKLFMFVLLVLTIQIVTCVLFYMPVPYGHIQYKYFMRIPIGASNYIACFIVPISMYLIGSYKNHLHKLCVVAVLFADLILLKNRSGLLTTCVVFTLCMICSKDVRLSVKKMSYDIYAFLHEKIRHSPYKYVIIVITSLAVIGLAVVVAPSIGNYLMGYVNSITDDSMSFLDKITSKRTIIYEYYIGRFIENPLFGIGPEYYVTGTRAHNFIIEVLALSGITGFVCYGGALLLILLKPRIKKTSLIGLYVFVVTILIQGLFEISVFMLGIDVLLWSGLGLIYRYKSKSLTWDEGWLFYGV